MIEFAELRAERPFGDSRNYISVANQFESEHEGRDLFNENVVITISETPGLDAVDFEAVVLTRPQVRTLISLLEQALRL